MWNIKRTGSYEFDCHLGTELARETIRQMRSMGDQDIIRAVVRDMIQAGEFGGVEVGFLGLVGKLLSPTGGGRV